MSNEKRVALLNMKYALERLEDAFNNCEETFESDKFDCNDYITDKKGKDKYPFNLSFDEMLSEVSDWVWSCVEKIDKELNGYRTIKITAGMMSDFEIITTNAPDSVIKANMQYINSCVEDGEKIKNPYAIIESMGYVVNLIGNQDDLSSEELEDAIIDKEFDYCNI